MKIILAKESGFCFGVQRAAEMTLNIKSGSVNTFGPLIHNPEFTRYLEERGIHIANSINDIKSDNVVIRSHGVTKKIEKEIKNKGKNIIDATCPFVKRVQKLAEDFGNKGYKVLLLGEKNHPEVIGIKSYVKEFFVISGPNDKPNIKISDNIILISQTTQNKKLFKETSEKLKERFPNIKIIDTICDATEKRQAKARQLAKEVDIMIIIGGKSSSNTTRLKEICEKIIKTYHVESEKELKKNWFKAVKTVGVTAGASTPSFSINTVLDKIRNYEN